MAGHGSPSRAEFLASLGIEVLGSGFFGFWLSEDDPRFAAVERAGLVSTLARTVFTSSELNEADWLEPESTGRWAYPQPEKGFGYKQSTYDPTGLCTTCGIGLVQVAPFRVNRDPKAGRKNIFQLHWVYDQFFTTPQLAESVFQKFGIETRAVLATSSRIRESVLQIVIAERVDIDVTSLEGQSCVVCGRTKYEWVARGYSPASTSEPGAHLVRSRQWFGSGGSAGNMILMSQALRTALAAASASGLGFRPTPRRAPIELR